MVGFGKGRDCHCAEAKKYAVIAAILLPEQSMLLTAALFNMTVLFYCFKPIIYVAF